MRRYFLSIVASFCYHSIQTAYWIPLVCPVICIGINHRI
nr:MAG TPA: hypothetical protein [Caudoviricetes sp.]DAR28688.1 MAG TPA: hypothetical protein [Caudoviricetes sp.]